MTCDTCVGTVSVALGWMNLHPWASVGIAKGVLLGQQEGRSYKI